MTDMQQATADLHYWQNLAPQIDFRVWTTARSADEAELVRLMRVRDAQAYVRYLRSFPS